MGSLWSWERAAAVLPVLLEAFVQVTLVATVVGSVVAAVLGLVVAITRRLAPAVIAKPVHGIMEFIRMTPLVIQLLFVYYALPADVPALWIGIGVLGVHYAAYMAEVYRAGIESIPRGQWEAATALSLPVTRTWRRVVVPQALRATVPALGTWVISMFKDTPFLIAITVADMVSNALEYGGDHFRYVEVIVLAGVLFLIASYPTSLAIRKLEERIAFTT